MEYPDICVDLETTGTQPDKTAIIQLAAVRFNMRTGEVDPNFFNASLAIPSTRFWDEDTREWWADKPVVLERIWSKMRDPRTVMQEFHRWSVKDGDDNLTLWAKPTHFEFPFISSYFREFGVSNPFPFWLANDQNTFLRARHFPEAPPAYEKEIPFDGDEHDALYDTLHQVKVLLTCYEATK
jgi:hypothetical protein